MRGGLQLLLGGLCAGAHLGELFALFGHEPVRILQTRLQLRHLFGLRVDAIVQLVDELLRGARLIAECAGRRQLAFRLQARLAGAFDGLDVDDGSLIAGLIVHWSSFLMRKLPRLVCVR